MEGDASTPSPGPGDLLWVGARQACVGGRGPRTRSREQNRSAPGWPSLPVFLFGEISFLEVCLT